MLLGDASSDKSGVSKDASGSQDADTRGGHLKRGYMVSNGALYIV